MSNPLSKPSSFGERVAFLREQLGMNQSELGRRIKKSSQTIRKIEAGGNARSDTLKALVRELQTTKAYLLIGDEATTIVAEDENTNDGQKVPLVEWKNIGLRIEEIHEQNLVIDNMPLVSGDPKNIICAKLEGGDWMNLTDDTIVFIRKGIELEDVAHNALIVISVNNKNLVRKLLIDGNKRIAITTNTNMPQREHEIQQGEFIGTVAGIYISAE